MFVLFSFLSLSYYPTQPQKLAPWIPLLPPPSYRPAFLSIPAMPPSRPQSPNHAPKFFSPSSISYHTDKIICLDRHIWLWTYGKSYHFIPSRCKTAPTGMKHVSYHSSLMASLLPPRGSLSLKFHKNNSNLPLGPYLLSPPLYLVFSRYI